MAEYTDAGRTSGEEQMKLKYAVVYEQTPSNYSAYAPDLPGCISTGKTWDDIRKMIQEAISFHIEDLMENGEPVPTPQMSVGEAMAYHMASLSEAGDPVLELETTIGMVCIEAEVDSLQVAKVS